MDFGAVVRAAEESVGHPSRPDSAGGVTVRCPAHDDRSPSLHISPGGGGRVLLKCFAGCTTEDVVSALGMTMSDLSGNLSSLDERPPRADGTSYYYYHRLGDDGEARAVYRLVKECRDGRRDFYFEAPQDGQWVRRRLTEAEHVPYGEPALRDTERGFVYLCEGEKDADTLAGWGLVASSFKRWKNEWTARYLVGRDVVVVQDEDAPGRKEARALADRLLGQAKSVRIVSLADAGEVPDDAGWDVTDWRDYRGGTKEKLLKLVDETEPYRKGVSWLVRLDKVERRAVQWIWPARIPCGYVTILDGNPGAGKSAICCDLISRITRGALAPDETHRIPRGHCVYLSTEDGADDVIGPRLDVAGANPSMVSVLRGEDLSRVVDELADGIDECEATFAVLDPLTDFTDDVDTNNYQQSSRAMRRLCAVAKKTGCAIVVLRHLNKTQGAEGVQRGQGSMALAGKARSVMLAEIDPVDKNQHVLTPIKINLAANPGRQRYQLHESIVRVGDKDVAVPYVRWVR